MNMLPRAARRFSWVVLFAAQAVLASPSSHASDTPAVREGALVRLTREAVLNGVTMAKGTELKVVGVKRDDQGIVARVDLQQIEGEKRLFKAITSDALAALTAPPNSAATPGDKTSMFKVGAQIPILRELSLGDIVFAKGSVLQIERVEKDKSGKVVKVALRETTGEKRLVRGVGVEQFLLALSPEDVTWPDGAVGRQIQLGAELRFGGDTFAKGTRFVVTRVEREPKGNEVIKVDLREMDGAKRSISSVHVAVLKQNGALGTAAGAPR